MFVFALSIAVVLANVVAFGLFYYFIFCYKGDNGFKILMYICVICLIVAVVIAYYIFKS